MFAFVNSRPFLAAEFLIICVLIPSVIIFNGLAPFMFVFLWGVTGYGLLIYRYSDDFTSYRDLWGWGAVNWPNMKPLLWRWLLASAAMVLFTMWYDPERLFYLPLNRPEILPGLMLFYPAFSALPQEFVFCTYFFARFRRFFGSGALMVFMSALIFAYAHMLYINPVAPSLSFLGGLIFALTYRKTRSLALVTIEHALYGNSLFIIGLGWYFYSGNVQAG